MEKESAVMQVVPHIDLAAMATVVRDLLAGDDSRLRDELWLRERSQAAGVGGNAGAALEALRMRLATGGTLLGDVIGSSW